MEAAKLQVKTHSITTKKKTNVRIAKKIISAVVIRYSRFIDFNLAMTFIYIVHRIVTVLSCDREGIRYFQKIPATIIKINSNGIICVIALTYFNILFTAIGTR
jgi:hypothetical protein